MSPTDNRRTRQSAATLRLRMGSPLTAIVAVIRRLTLRATRLPSRVSQRVEGTPCLCPSPR